MRVVSQKTVLTTLVLAVLAARFGSYGLGAHFGGIFDPNLGLGGAINADLRLRLNVNMSSNVDSETLEYTGSKGKGFLQRSGKAKVNALFGPDSAEIRLYREDKNSFVLHRIIALRETGTTGDATLALVMKNNWNDGEATVFNGVNCTHYTLSTKAVMVSDASVTVNLTVHAYVFDNDYNVTVKGTTFNGTFQSVKFSFVVGKWPFQPSTQGLSVIALVKASGKNYLRSSSDYLVGDASLTFPEAANVDGVETDISFEFSLNTFDTSSRSALLLEMKFPKFADSLEYDPIVGFAAEQDESVATTRPDAAAGVSTLVSALIAILTALVLH